MVSAPNAAGIGISTRSRKHISPAPLPARVRILALKRVREAVGRDPRSLVGGKAPQLSLQLLLQLRQRALGERGAPVLVALTAAHEDLAPVAEASLVANRMREMGILLGTDGPHHNVVKIRPPMPFDVADADRLVESFERILAEDLK